MILIHCEKGGIIASLIDNNNTMQIIGCLIKEPTLLLDPKVHINEQLDFTEKVHKLIYSAIYNLFNSAAVSITPIDIDNYLSNYNVNYEYYKNSNGLQYLNDAEDLAQPENFFYYYDRFKKLSLLRYLKSQGYNIKEVYNEEIQSPKKEIEMEEKFNAMSLNDIFNFFKMKIDDAEKKFRAKNSDRSIVASENIDEIVNSFKYNPEVGLPFYNDIMNTIVRGQRKGKFYISSSSTGAGKALLNGTKVLSEKGYIPIETLKINDKIYGEDGKLYNVIGVYPQGKKQIWEVEFSDGNIIKCCEEHLWNFQTSSMRHNKSKKWNTATIKQIKENYSLRNKNNDGWNIYIPMNKIIDYPKKELPLAPYTLGALLGDGYLRDDGTYGFTNKEADIVERVEKELNKVDAHLVLKKGKTIDYTINIGREYKGIWQIGKLRRILRELGLSNTHSDTKFIPEIYKYTSYEDRLELIRGIIDTDGYIARSSYDITLKSEKLIDDIAEVIESLGGIATKSIKNTFYKLNDGTKKDCGKAYRLFIKMPKNSDVLFYCQNRANQWKGWGQTEARRTIRDIRITKEYGEMTCIKVDNPTSLFLTEHCIVTHNTRSMAGEACHLAYPFRYNKVAKRWIQKGLNKNILFITTEMEPDEIQTMIPAYLADVNEEHILQARYEDDEEERVKCAMEIMKAYPYFYIEQIPDPSAAQIQSLIRFYVQNYGVEYIFFDYIFASPGLLGEYRDLGLRTDEALLLLSNSLKEVATECNVYIRSATQLNASALEQGDGKKIVIRNQNMLRASKSISDKIDVGYITMPITLEEVAKLEPVCQKLCMPLPTHVSDIYKNRRGRYTSVRVWHNFDLGTCRMQDLFVTDHMFQPINIQIVKYVFGNEEQVFDTDTLLKVINDSNF